MSEINVHSVEARPLGIPTTDGQFLTAVDNGGGAHVYLSAEKHFEGVDTDYLVSLRRTRDEVTHSMSMTIEGAERLIVQLQMSVDAVKARREAELSYGGDPEAPVPLQVTPFSTPGGLDGYFIDKADS